MLDVKELKEEELEKASGGYSESSPVKPRGSKYRDNYNNSNIKILKHLGYEDDAWGNLYRTHLYENDSLKGIILIYDASIDGQYTPMQ